MNLTGTQYNPVKDVHLSNVKYTASGATYMERHGVPSAGDWALDRFAAVFLQGTENITMSDCTFERVDGNAVMVSGYNRNATIVDSDFSFIGGNAIALWGYTNETEFDPGRPGVRLENFPEAGVDGTDGEHPRYTTVKGCTVREVGLYVVFERFVSVYHITQITRVSLVPLIHIIKNRSNDNDRMHTLE